MGIWEKPQVEYSNLEEYETKKREAYQIIKNGLDEWIIKDNFEYEHMSWMGLTTRQGMNIPNYISQALNLITKGNHIEWSKEVSYQIIYGIEGFIKGFIKINKWDLIYSQLDSNTMAKLIYNNIIWQLDDDEHSPCILDDIAVFTDEEREEEIHDDIPE